MNLLKHTLVSLVFLYSFVSKFQVKCMPVEEKLKLRDQVKEMFLHGYNSYMKYAYPADELMPLSCKGRVRGVDPSRGDIDDSLGLFSLTLIDSLDSLAVLGELEEFERAVQLVISEVSFDNDVVISVFETNIRVLGGLLGGHMAAITLKKTGQGMEWYTGELLDMAKELGYRLLPAFNTTTGIPYPRVNLKYGLRQPESRTGTESDTCTACGGTMIMEFGALTRLTGEPIFEVKAKKAMESLWRYRNRQSDLVGTVINIHNGDWVRRDSGVGAGVDSYYEYCLKAYILLGDEMYLQRFNTHYRSIMKYINQGPMFLNVQMHQPDRMAHSYMDALFAFWPGLQVLKGDISKAIETHDMLYEVAKKHIFLPEAFTTDFEVHWGQHPLRPEFVESTYFLYEATKDPYYLEAGKYILEKIELHARVPCGFAAMRDVRTLSHEDKMDSFVLAETFKYLYLLFAEKEDVPFDIHQFIFTTEAHILPISLSTNNATQNNSDVLFESDDTHDYVCPNTLHEGSGSKVFAQEIRKKSRSKKHGSCSKKPTTGISLDPSKPPKLRAEEFVPSNADHTEILKTMGIKVVQTEDGRIQLMHTASSALTMQDAANGIKFMQEMIELAKKRGDTENIENNPRVVQLMSAPFHGSVVLNAGPAQFGLDLSKGDVGVGAEVVLGDPFKGCSAMINPEDVKHRVVVLERGECMFIDKVRLAQTAGCVGVIVIDNNVGSSSDSQPIFAMSGDGTSNDVQIPAVFLFSNEGNILKRAIEESLAVTGEKLRVRLASKASEPEKPDKANAADKEDKADMKVTKITVNGKQLHEQIVKSCMSSQQKEIQNERELMDVCAKNAGCQRFSCSRLAVMRGIAVKCILWRKQEGEVTESESKEVLSIYNYLKQSLKFGGKILISDKTDEGVINFVQEVEGNLLAFSLSQSKPSQDCASESSQNLEKGTKESEEKRFSVDVEQDTSSDKSYSRTVYNTLDKTIYIEEIVCKDKKCEVQTTTRKVDSTSSKGAVLTEKSTLDNEEKPKVKNEKYDTIKDSKVDEIHDSISDIIESEDTSEAHSQEMQGKNSDSERLDSKVDPVNIHKEDKDKNEPNVKEERTSAKEAHDDGL